MKKALVTFLVFIPLFVLKAAEPFVIEAPAQGDLISSTFDIVSQKLAVSDDGKVELRVTAEGNCRLEKNPWDDVFPPDRPGGEPHEGWVCDEKEGVFVLPATVYLKGNYIVYDDGIRHFKLAKLKSFLFWEWLETRDNITIEVQPPYDKAFILVY